MNITFDLETMINDSDLIIEIPLNVEVTVDVASNAALSELVGFTVSCRDIPGLNTKAIEQHLNEQYKRDKNFRRRINYRAEEVLRPPKTYTEEAGLQSMTPPICTRPCIDRRDPWSAPQDSAGPVAERKVG